MPFEGPQADQTNLFTSDTRKVGSLYVFLKSVLLSSFWAYVRTEFTVALSGKSGPNLDFQRQVKRPDFQLCHFVQRYVVASQRA